VANERWDYITLRSIPDRINAGHIAYNEGEGIMAQVAEDLGLVVGEDVAPARPDSMPQPAGNASRAQWAKYAAIQGLDPERVDGMTRDELRDHFAEDDEAAPAEAAKGD
jgi:hypothetical protein